MGGMFGESKYEVQKKLPAVVSPITILVTVPNTAEQVLQQMALAGLQFPVIFKPELGERGRLVRKMNSTEQVAAYLAEVRVNFLVQEFVDLPLEFGVFYVRYPSQNDGAVISIVGKEMLFVEGDGKRTLQQLIFEKDRARLQWSVLQTAYRNRLQEVLPSGDRLELVSIGNHCLGTKFMNYNHLITPKLTEAFNRISRNIDGFYFGRFDLRAASVEDLEKGDVQVMELNGCGAEPAHIYDPDFSLWAALAVLYHHWRHIYKISRENHARGVPYVSFREGWNIYKRFRSLTSDT